MAKKFTPRPWSAATCVTVPPITVPAGADKEQLEAYRRRVEDTLHWATDVAEQWAETGRWPEELERHVASDEVQVAANLCG